MLDTIPGPIGLEPNEATETAAPANGDKDFLRVATERLRYGLEADRENREADIDDRKFRAGEQWPEEVKQQRVNRPCLTINRTGQFVRQVTGDIRLNKPAIKISPAEGGNPQTAEVIEGLVRNIERASKAQRVYVDAAEDAATGGMGYWRVLTEYAAWDGWTQDICIRHIRNALGVVFDPDMTDQTGRDAKWCFVYDDMPREEYDALYPGSAPGEISDGDASNAMDTRRAWAAGDDKLVRVAEYWELRASPCVLFLMSDGSTLKDPTPEDLMAAQLQGKMVQQRREGTCPAVFFSLIDGKRVLRPPEQRPGLERIPIVRVIGEEVRIGSRVVRHGLVRFLKDPQRIDNYAQSATVERYALAPKAPFLATPKHLEGFEQEWRQLSVGNPNVLLYNPDPLTPGGAPQRIAPAPIEPGLTQLALMSSDNMKSVTGIYDASLGARSNETSGVAIDARKQEGDVGTFVYMDNLADAITETGKIVVSLIPTVYDTPRMIQILGPNMKPQSVPVNGDMPIAPGVPQPKLTVGKYDVAVDTGPSFTTRRNAAVAGMTEFIRANPQAGPLLGDLLARNSDWPDSDEVSTRLAPFAKLAIVQAEAQIEQIMMQRQMMQTQMLMGGMPGAPAPDGFQQGPQPTPGPRPA